MTYIEDPRCPWCGHSIPIQYPPTEREHCTRCGRTYDRHIGRAA